MVVVSPQKPHQNAENNLADEISHFQTFLKSWSVLYNSMKFTEWIKQVLNLVLKFSNKKQLIFKVCFNQVLNPSIRKRIALSENLHLWTNFKSKNHPIKKGSKQTKLQRQISIIIQIFQQTKRWIKRPENAPWEPKRPPLGASTQRNKTLENSQLT